MNPRTIIIAAKAASDALRLATKQAASSADWLAINGSASTLLSLLHQIECCEFYEKSIKQEAHDATFGLVFILRESKAEYETPRQRDL
jgi:hypothetical protein